MIIAFFLMAGILNAYYTFNDERNLFKTAHLIVAIICIYEVMERI